MAKTISSGITSSDFVLTEDLTVESGGAIVRVTANSGGNIYLFGQADSVTVNNGAQMSV